MPGLDGLRAFAIAGVVAYHLRLLQYPGGIYGVDIFFVLSGFLITGLLIREWQRSGTISFLGFYKRRLLRLMPALLTMIAVYLVIALCIKRNMPAVFRESAMSISGAFNWFRLHQIKPFNTMEHLWSLAIEFQFCLIWPFFIFGILKLTKKIEAIGVAGLITFGLVHLWRQNLIQDGADWRRLYLGTELRLDAFAAGAVAQVILISKAQIFSQIRAIFSKCPTLIGLAALLLHGYLVLEGNSVTMHMHSYWLTPCIGISAMLIVLAIAVSNKSFFSRFFAWKIFTQLGFASYGIYLWHYPINQILPRKILAWEYRCLLVVLASIALGFFSYYCVERRFMRGKSGKSQR